MRQTINFQSCKFTSVVGRATGDSATEKLITLDSPGVKVVDIGRYYGLMNDQAQAVDSQGRVHLVMWHCSDDSYAYTASQGYTSTGTWEHAIARRYNHYWRDTSGQWHHYEMPWIAGSRPKLFIRQNGDAFLIYQSVRNPCPCRYGSRGIHTDLPFLFVSKEFIERLVCFCLPFFEISCLKSAKVNSY